MNKICRTFVATVVAVELISLPCFAVADEDFLKEKRSQRPGDIANRNAVVAFLKHGDKSVEWMSRSPSAAEIVATTEKQLNLMSGKMALAAREQVLRDGGAGAAKKIQEQVLRDLRICRQILNTYEFLLDKQVDVSIPGYCRQWSQLNWRNEFSHYPHLEIISGHKRIVFAIVTEVHDNQYKLVGAAPLGFARYENDTIVVHVFFNPLIETVHVPMLGKEVLSNVVLRIF